MSNYTYKADEAVRQAVTPPPATPIPYRTGRSGLEVQLGFVIKPNESHYKHVRERYVSVKIDGTADWMDAEQLSKFFAELARQLKEA